jgi:hypothetical protein
VKLSFLLVCKFNPSKALWTSSLLLGNFGNRFRLSLYMDIATFFKSREFNQFSSIFWSSPRMTLDGRCINKKSNQTCKYCSKWIWYTRKLTEETSV